MPFLKHQYNEYLELRIKREESELTLAVSSSCLKSLHFHLKCFYHLLFLWNRKEAIPFFTGLKCREWLLRDMLISWCPSLQTQTHPAGATCTTNKTLGVSRSRDRTDREVLKHVCRVRHVGVSSETPRAAESRQPQWETQVLAAGMILAILKTWDWKESRWSIGLTPCYHQQVPHVAVISFITCSKPAVRGLVGYFIQRL